MKCATEMTNPVGVANRQATAVRVGSRSRCGSSTERAPASLDAPPRRKISGAGVPPYLTPAFYNHQAVGHADFSKHPVDVILHRLL